MHAEHFDHDHIHTTPEGRHFRHGDGREVDGDGNVLPELRETASLGSAGDLRPQAQDAQSGRSVPG